jgi:phospholipid transport system substrate-binding protein
MTWILSISWLLTPPAPASAAAAGGDAAEVRSVIERSVNSVLDVLKDKDLGKEQRKKRVLAKVDEVFDLALMGKLALGRAHWPKLDEGQRRKFSDLFVGTIKDSYYEKIDLFTDETVEFEAPAPAEKGKYQMGTSVISKGQRYKLLYKLYKGASGWKVYDVEIEGISLVRSYGSQYDQFLQKFSVEALLAKMKEKSLDTPEELKSKSKKAAEGQASPAPAGKG